MALQVTLHNDINQQLALHAILPANYPSLRPPSVHLAAQGVPGNLLARTARELQELFTPGDTCLSSFIHCPGLNIRPVPMQRQDS